MKKTVSVKFGSNAADSIKDLKLLTVYLFSIILSVLS